MLRFLCIKNVTKLSLIVEQRGVKSNYFREDFLIFNEDYFKILWSRFKKKCPEIRKHTTIYFFRHSGAIEIFKRTGSLHNLQRAMGHSSLNVSLTYSRGLEITELKEEDMPKV